MKLSPETLKRAIVATLKKGSVIAQMKQLQLSPPLLIITMGYPGSGKSYFARQFAELYGLARISEDRVRYELFESPQFNVDEADIIGRMNHYMLEQIMQGQQSVIFEGSGLKISERKSLFDLAKKHKYRTLTVWMQTDIETSMQRSMKRDKRNPDSKYAFELDKSTFSKIKERLQKPTEREVAVVVSGKHAFRSQCLTVLRKIATIYSEAISTDEFNTKAKNTPRVTSIKVQTDRRFIQ